MLLADFAREQGIGLEKLLPETGIRESDLRDPSVEITGAQELTLVRNLVRAADHQPGLGLLAGRRSHATAHGVWGFALLTSATVRDAITAAVRYADLTFSFLRLELSDTGDTVTLRYDDSGVPADLRRFLVERDLATTLTLQRDVLPAKLPVCKLELPFAPHLLYHTFAEEAGVLEVVFSAPMTVVTFDERILKMPLSQANPTLAELYAQQCADLIQQRRARVGFSGRVREILVRQGATATQAVVAADLAVSVRTLRRRLGAEGTTFRELEDETFGVLAEELLANGLSVTQVAARLGYSSSSALTHAFKSWRGVTPSSFARARGQDVNGGVWRDGSRAE